MPSLLRSHLWSPCRLEKAEKEAKEESLEAANQRRLLSHDQLRLDSRYIHLHLGWLSFSSQWEGFTDSWRVEWAQTAEWVLPPLCTLQLSSSTWLLRCSSWQETPARTWRWSASPRDICNWPSEVMKNLTRSSRLPSLVVVSSLTSTRLSSSSKPRRTSDHARYIS